MIETYSEDSKEIPEGNATCVLCGKSFEKFGRRKVCQREHYRYCLICGKKFYINKYLDRGISNLPVTCSSECRNKLRSQKSRSKEVQQKAKATNLERYGNEVAVKNKQVRERISSGLKEDRHKLTCVVCGKTFYVERGKYKRKCCSPECFHTLQVQNNLNRSIRSGNALLNEQCKDRVASDKANGYVSSSQRPEVRAKISQSMKGHSYSQSDESRRKISIALTELNNDPTRKSQVIKKRQATVIKKYGVNNVFQSDNVKHKIQTTCEQRYGVLNPSKNSEIKRKQELSRKQTMISRYGRVSPMEVDEFKVKRAQTLFEHVNSSESPNVSLINKKLHDFLKVNAVDTDYEYPIDGFNYDLHIVGTNVLIELDPSASHSSVETKFPAIDKNYHVKKSNVAIEHNMRCIHVFDWDDWNRILMLVKLQKKIWARKCEVRVLNQYFANEFTDKYHIQGKCRGQVLNLGLFYKGNLVELMTFGTPRYNKHYSWELLRLCSKPEVCVVGGASKLFKAAVTNFETLDSVISYCDYSKFSGSVYNKIGMTLKDISQPQEIWSKGKKYVTANLLRSRGYDQMFNTHYGDKYSNNDLMLKNGWLPVFDCGQKVFEWYRH